MRSESGDKLRFIQPGKPTQNAYVESFNGNFRDECLNANWFASLAEACKTIEAWHSHYNKVRSHSALGYQTPADFTRQFRRPGSDLQSPPAPCNRFSAMAYGTSQPFTL